MSQKRTAKVVVWARRLTQAAFLGLFIGLFGATHVTEGVPPQTSARLRLFFDLDPLVAAATWLSAHPLPAFPLLALVTIVVTLLLGRVFCGWVCPLGTVHTAVSWLRKFRRTPAGADHWVRWQRAKYYLLAALLLMALFGSHWIGVFDPISLLYRTTTTALYPGVQYAVDDGSTAVYQSDPHLGPLHLESATEPVYRFLRDFVFVRKRQAFDGGTLLLLLFTVIVALNLYKARFWCRYVCPLGGLLGLCAQRPVMRLANAPGCTGCGRCATRCPAGANPDKPGDWRTTECFSCWNCVAACNRGEIAFKFKSPLPAPSTAKLDLSKRALLTAGIGGVSGLILFRLSPQAQARTYNPSLIRPPGARDERAFLQRCVQCGMCMKACPTGGIQPTLFEAGIEGIWTPMLVFRIGYCEYNCNLCGQVCPTQAIQPLPLEEKKKLKIGLATVDTTRCLPYAYDRECMICEEHCPVGTKAIFFVAKEVQTRDGKTLTLKQPHVDPDQCTGCGICENVCVFKDRAAIRVTSANESRHSGNRPILPGLDAPSPEPPPSNSSGTSGNPYGSS